MKNIIVTVPFMSVRLSDQAIIIDNAVNVSEDKIKENILKMLFDNKYLYPFLDCIEFDEKKFTIEMNSHQDTIVMHVDDHLLSRIQGIQAELALLEIKSTPYLMISAVGRSLINFEKKFREIEPYLSKPSKIEAKNLLERYRPIVDNINIQWAKEQSQVLFETFTFFRSNKSNTNILKELEGNFYKAQEIKAGLRKDKQQLPSSCGMEFTKNKFR
jgi:hypothetical protein